jgi:hypothetical protein
LPYLAELEKANIPTVLIDFEDQDEFVKQEALVQGVPKIRYIHASRTLAGPVDVDRFIEPMLKELTRPLTKEEKESGRWTQQPPRILFEGTLDDAETFYQQSERLPGLLNAPYAVYSDGFPVRVPTEERVREMLKGTSHKPDELIVCHEDVPASRWEPSKKKGAPVTYMPI